MTRRTIDGTVADYRPVEDALCRSLIADGHHDEVRVLHALKVELDAVPLEDADEWHRERQLVEAAVPTQEALL